jgi:hydrogenase/urease accessory protein HupE
MKWVWTSVVLLLAAVAGSPQASAHIMTANKATLAIKETNAYLTISIPVSALSGFDDNHDQLIDATELSRHSGALTEQINRRVRMRADESSPVESITFLSSPLTGEDAIEPTDYVVALIAQRFEKNPQIVEMWTDLFGPAAKEQRLAITATRGQVEELAVLTPDQSKHRFFQGGLAVFTDFVGIGMSHILLGFDHLLFLLTIIVAAMTVRQWLVIISVFTIAHSITLTAASLGYVSVSADFVEPLIAASIVALALDNLFGGASKPFYVRTSLVFACGLLHGLGFASSLAGFGLSANNMFSSLLGFNLGVEIGQLLFVGTACGALWLMTHLPLAITRERMVMPVSILAAIPGAILLATRLFPTA